MTRRRHDDTPTEMITLRTVDNPRYEAGHPIELRRLDLVVPLRDDPFGQMYARHQLDGRVGDRIERESVGTMRHEAGRAFQRAWETAGIGAIKSLDFTQEPVDGSARTASGFTDRSKQANARLSGWRRNLGKPGYLLLTYVLIEKMTVIEAANRLYRVVTKATQTYAGHRFRECLDVIAEDHGLKT